MIFGIKGLMSRALVGAVALIMIGVAAIPADAQAQARKATPYWASISENEARMRVGPSLDYPSNWIYRRRDLPVKVVQVLGNWRKIEDSTGAQGWMHVRLLSDTATAIVTGDIVMLRESADDRAPVLYRAETGVVGRISGCSNGWCNFNVSGQRGFVRVDGLWGATN